MLNGQNQITFNGGWTDLVDGNFTLILTNATQGEHWIRVDLELERYVPITGVPLIFTENVNMSASVDFFVYRRIQPQVNISGLDVYKTNQTVFNVTTNELDMNVSYSLDGAANVTLPQNQSPPFQDSYTYNVTLLGLPNGAQTLTVYTKDVFNNTATSQKNFTVQQPMSLQTIAAIAGTAIAVACAAILLLFKKSKNKKSQPTPKETKASTA